MILSKRPSATTAAQFEFEIQSPRRSREEEGSASIGSCDMTIRLGRVQLTPMKATSLCDLDLRRTGRIQRVMGLSTMVLVRTPQTGGSGPGMAAAFSAADARRAAWRSTVSVTHWPSRSTFVWNAMMAGSLPDQRQPRRVYWFEWGYSRLPRQCCCPGCALSKDSKLITRGRRELREVAAAGVHFPGVNATFLVEMISGRNCGGSLEEVSGK